MYLSAVSSDALGDTFEYFLKAYLVKEKKDLGEYFTPRHLVKFLVELANPHLGDKVYDPFCGTGGILIESYKHVKKRMAWNEENENKLAHETLYGHESVKNLCRIAKMNMILAGDGHNNIEKLDSWANPVNEEYDIVITNMPFGWGSLAEDNKTSYCQKHRLSREEHKFSSCCDKSQGQKAISKCPQYKELKKEIKNCLKCQELVQRKKKELEEINEKYNNYYLNSLNADILCVEHCFKAINPENPNGRIAMIIPQGILFNKDKKSVELRKFIYDNSLVENIIFLPFFSFRPYAEPNAVILYLTQVKQKKSRQKEVWCFEVKNDGLSENQREPIEGENDFDIFWKFKGSSEEEKLKNGFQKLEMEIIEKNDYISIPRLYKKFDFEGSKYDMINLGELVEEVDIKRGNIDVPIWTLTKDRGFIPSKEKFKEQVYSEDTSDYKIVSPKHFAYRAPGVNEGYIGYNHREKSICISHYYPVFKVKNDKKVKSEYLYFALQSEKFREQANSFLSGGTARSSLGFADFCQIKVPVPTLEEQQKIIEELNNIEKMIENSKENTRTLKNALSLSLCYEIGKNNNKYLAEILEEVKERNSNNQTPIWSITNDEGFVDESKEHSERVASKDISSYKLVLPNNFAYNPARINVGSLALNESDKVGCVSPSYIVFQIKNPTINPKYLYFLLNSSIVKEQIKNFAYGGVRESLSFDGLGKISVPINFSLEKQQEIIKEWEENGKEINKQKQSIKYFQERKRRFLNNLWESS